MNIIRTQSRSAFTLIETLVAISILMVAIAGPLTIANKGLISAVGSRDQTIASYLAQDLMEYVKNVRDNNEWESPNSSSWLSGIPSTCTSSSPCIANTGGVSINNSPSITSISACNFSGSTIHLDVACQLYINSTYGYYEYNTDTNFHSSTDQPTQFYREFTITNLNSNKNALLTVYVYWANGTILNKVILQSVIFNTNR